jgi:hypothetical protein
MALDTVMCRVRLQLPGLPAAKPSLTPLNEHSDIPTTTRIQWAENLTKAFNPNSNPSQTIRPLDIILFLDGSAEIHHQPIRDGADDQASNSEDTTDQSALYPAPYRIPLKTILSLDPKHRVLRAECFALGSVLYELFNNTPPFVDLHLSDKATQARFNAADFPRNVLDFPKWPIILSCWSLEFVSELRRMCKYSLHI